MAHTPPDAPDPPDSPVAPDAPVAPSLWERIRYGQGGKPAAREPSADVRARKQ